LTSFTHSIYCFIIYSLRGKYGTDSLRNAVECSLIPIAGIRETEFFKSLLEERAMMDALLKSGRSKPAKKSHWVSMENLLSFCFPSADRHPLSTGKYSSKVKERHANGAL